MAIDGGNLGFWVLGFGFRVRDRDGDGDGEVISAIDGGAGERYNI